jgi:crossover junction endodeoxyribonuclease RuvC
MIVMGIDPGVNIVGYGIVEGTKSSPLIIEYGIVHTNAQSRENSHFRLLEIANDLEQLIVKHKPVRAVVEDLFFFKNAKTVIQVAQSRGVILYLLTKYNVEVISKTPLQVKQTLTGYGRATKSQIQEMVKKIYKLESIPKPDDAADALAMAWLGL